MDSVYLRTKKTVLHTQTHKNICVDKLSLFVGG